MCKYPVDVFPAHDSTQVPQGNSQVPHRQAPIQSDAMNFKPFPFNLRDLRPVGAGNADRFASCTVFTQ